jgi:hypothetical protein
MRKRHPALLSPVVAVVLFLMGPDVAHGQPLPPGNTAVTDYYDQDLDNLYDVDPRNYGYLPRSYEYPWLYSPTYRGGTYFGPYGYGGPTGYGLYRDGYEDDDWYYDYYDADGGYFTGLDYDDRRNFRGTDYDLLKSYYPDDDLYGRWVPYPLARPIPRRIDYDDWYRETYGDDGFDGVEKPQIEWYEW